MRRVRVKKIRGDALAEDDIRDMWHLRMSFKETQPGFDFEADYRYFADFCRRCRHVFRLVDARGTMRGFYVIHVVREEWEGRTYMRIIPEYAYVEKEYRGSPAMRLAYLRLAPYLVRYLYLPRYGTATITPSSYLLYSDAFRVYTHGDADTPAWERSLLDRIGPEFGGAGWDPIRKVIVKNASLRGERPPRRFRTRAHGALYAHYVRQNPDWQQGHQLVCVFPITVKAIATTLRGAVLRARRRTPQPSVDADVRVPAPREGAVDLTPRAEPSQQASLVDRVE